MDYINETEKFWKHSYRVHLHEFDTEGLIVNADCEQDALDYAADHAEKLGQEGLFLTRDEQLGLGEDDYYIVAGNHGRALSSDYIRIAKID